MLELRGYRANDCVTRAGSDLVCDWCDDDSLISQTVRSRRCFTYIVPAIIHKNTAHCMLGPYLRVHVWLNNNNTL